jgi:TonB family protein
MSTPYPRASRRIPVVIVSLACHAVAVIFLIAGATRATLKKPEPSTFCCVAALEVAGGSQAARLPMPVAPAASRYTKQPLAQEPLVRPTTPPMFRRPPKASGSNAEAARPRDLGTNSVAGNGSDAQNTTPAFPVFYPNPAVHDRSLLPESERHVVIDVQLTAGGEVVSENLVKGVGNALDAMAVEIVKTWRFQPATVNGKPVASEAEVIFSFSQRYPISDS